MKFEKLAKVTALLFGVSTLIVNYILFAFTFLLAYSAPGKAVTVYINNYGEANIELMLLLFSFPFAVYIIYKMLKGCNIWES